MVKTITAADVRKYAVLPGDGNPLHTDNAFAKASRFGEPIAHGMLSASVISACQVDLAKTKPSADPQSPSHVSMGIVMRSSVPRPGADLIESFPPKA